MSAAPDATPRSAGYARDTLLAVLHCPACRSQGKLAGKEDQTICSACGAYWTTAETTHLADTVFWSVTDTEQLSHGSVTDALSELFEWRLPTDWPDEVEVRAYQRMTGEVNLPALAETLAEVIEDAYDAKGLGDPDDFFETHDEKKLRARLLDFLEKFEAQDYKAWACESKLTVTVPLATWFRKMGYVEGDEDVAKYLAARGAAP